ncbi:MAG: UDP-N-acetylmuramoyl-L-alanyl-D-glutamate--2,6-diaminopimelate ligase, partial [Thermodesulfobacteriota bacterium]|nr:UDP-N-acetylmuramoyl-L-alanyl-D-glutamate--2,6-diaminopimelate ligase [Thermodesulfobacteriota bacterium]
MALDEKFHFSGIMKLNDLIKVLDEKEVIGDRSLKVSGISYNSKEAGKDFLFFAIKGNKLDGHDFIEEAVDMGAKAVVVEEVPKEERDVTVIKVPDSRLAMARMSAEFYKNPSSHLTLIGITGTNGKTTTSYLIGSIFEKAGFNTGIIGTIEYRYSDLSIPASITTPESLDLQKILREMVNNGVTHVVMEVSSHALDLKRVEALSFHAGVFTNFSQDHLDYHKTMDHYFQSKAKLFRQYLAAEDDERGCFAIINNDDPMGRNLADDVTGDVIYYGVKSKAQVFPEATILNLDGISAQINTPEGNIKVRSSLIGEFNLYNILAAASTCLSQNIPLEYIRDGIEDLNGVPGRFEHIKNSEDVHIIVDYAHTEDALERTLKAIKDLAKGRIITVFGCGGDRDRLKRPLMGGISGKYSDLTIITSDNPRTENP